MKLRYLGIGILAWFGLFIAWAALSHSGGSPKRAVIAQTTPQSIASTPNGQLTENNAATPPTPLVPVPTGNPGPLKLDPGLHDPSPTAVPPSTDSPALKQASDLQKLADEGWTALGNLPWKGKNITIYYGGTTGPRFVLNVVIEKGTKREAQREAAAYVRKGGEDPSSYQLEFTGRQVQQQLTLNELQGRMAAKNVFLSLLPYSSGHITVRFLGAIGAKARIGVFYGGSRAAAVKEFKALLKSYGQKSSRYIVSFRHN